MTSPLEGVEPTTVYYEDMSVGLSEGFSHIVTEKDIGAFAAVTGDRNPVHLDEEYGKASMFGGNIAHGLYTASLFSAILGMKMPGPGTIYLGQSLKFLAPVRPHDEIKVTATVKELIDKGRRVIIDCEAKVGDTVVLTGEATVMAPKKPA